jgi:hypothetical protein
MAKAKKMVRLAVDETSGVDHPAHLSEGWLVMKSANAEEIEAVIDSLTETPITKEDSVSDESTVVTEDAVVAEAVVAEAPATESPAEDKDARIAELEAELVKAKGKNPFMQGDDESDEDYKKRMKKMEDEAEAQKKMKKPMAKSAELEAVEKAVAVEKARADEAVALLQKERDERADSDAIAKAKNWNNLPLDAEKVGPALRRLSQIDEELTKGIESILDAVNTQAKTSNLFAEIGKSVDSSATDAYDRLTALAKAAVESGVAPTMETAMADVALANTDLYKQYLTEKGAK